MPITNERLLYWFRRVGWTQRELAREVARLGHALGHNVAPDSSRVRRWLEGEQPRHPVPDLLCSLFADRLGRPVTPEELGLAPSRRMREEISWQHAELVTTLQEFTRSDLMIRRRGLLGAVTTIATGSILENRLSGWLDDSRGRPVLNAEPGRIGTAEIAEIETATEIFWRWDARRGGGLYREAVVGQLKAMTDMLDYTYPESIARRLFRSVANLARLAGWMSHDVGLQSAAQRYFTLALHCSKEAGDVALGAEILSRMARQMIHIGQPRDAVALVALARRGGAGRLSSPELAVLTTCEAWAFASLGDVQEVDRAVGLAEEQFAAGQTEEKVTWIPFFDQAYVEGMAGHTYRTLADHHPAMARRAEPHIINAIKLRRRETYLRSNTFDLISLAGVRAIQGEYEEAGKIAKTAIVVAGGISSTRTFDRVRDIRDRARGNSHRSTGASWLATQLDQALSHN